MKEFDKIDKLMLMTNDPVHNMPALATLLHKVCGNNGKTFNEADRLIRLFMEKALESNDESA